MPILKAERLTQLKARAKAEVLRRNQSGSVASYGGSAYDYTVTPAAGVVLKTEHLDKIVAPLSAINSTAVPGKSGVRVLSENELANLETRVTAWSARSMTDQSGSDCKSGCTGTCYTGCATGCSGCGSGCPTGCSSCGSGCAGCSGCGSGCDGCSGCGSGCPNGCSGCGSGCGSGCTGDCDGDCVNNCARACGWSCHGSCSGCSGGGVGCSGCASGCSSNCTDGCSQSGYG